MQFFVFSSKIKSTLSDLVKICVMGSPPTSRGLEGLFNFHVKKSKIVLFKPNTFLITFKKNTLEGVQKKRKVKNVLKFVYNDHIVRWK